MNYNILADLMVVTHFLWILFLFFGALWGVRHKTVRLLHLLGLALAFYIQLSGKYCPLTLLELYFRSKYRSSPNYGGSFIIYYLEKIVYLQVPQFLILIATVLLCGFNLFIYLRYWRNRSVLKRRPDRPATPVDKGKQGPGNRIDR